MILIVSDLAIAIVDEHFHFPCLKQDIPVLNIAPLGATLQTAYESSSGKHFALS